MIGNPADFLGDADTKSSSQIQNPPMSERKESLSDSSQGAMLSAPVKKRSRETSDEAGFSPDELSKMSRSERKRHREKKRRSDVNKGFDDLMNLLIEIDPEVREEAEERARRGQWKGDMGAQEENVLSRVDLITRAVQILRRVHTENEQRKLIIARLTARDMGGIAVRQDSAENEIARMLMARTVPSESLARSTLDHQSLLQRAALGQLLQEPPRSATATGLLTQPFFRPGAGVTGVGGSLSSQARSLIELQGGAPAPQLGQNVGAMPNVYLQMLRNEATVAAERAARLRGQAALASLSSPPSEQGEQPPPNERDGR